MTSRTEKNVFAGLVGVIYAFFYWLWTATVSGGGHINFIWGVMFMFVEFFGLCFPLMAVLSINLRSMVLRMIFASLILFNLIASSLMIYGWVVEPNGEGLSDFSRMVEINGMGWIFVCAVAHFIPTLVFLAILKRSFTSDTSTRAHEGA